MRLKIRGGTVQHGEASLCVTCRHATIVKGRSFREEIVQCDRLSSGHDLIPFPVTSCSGYSDRRLPSIRDMEDIAWILRTILRGSGSGSSRRATSSLRTGTSFRTTMTGPEILPAGRWERCLGPRLSPAVAASQNKLGTPRGASKPSSTPPAVEHSRALTAAATSQPPAGIGARRTERAPRV
jgi:hypothetical protein